MSGLTPSRGNSEQNRQLGFSLIQMIIAIAIISIVTTFGILGITKARGHMRVQNSARRFAVLIEKARADSVRRHLAAGSQSWVKTFAPGTNTFQVSMDFDGNGTVQTRTFTLDPDCTFSTISQTASFDWRGRIPARLAFQITNGSISIPVDVSGSGDITVDAQAFEDDLIPDNTPTPVSGDVTADPTPLPTATPTPSQSPSGTPTPTPTATPTPNGNGNGSGNGNGNGNGSPTPTPTPTPTATPTPSVTPTPTPTPDLGSQCTASVSPSSLILSQTVTTNKTGTVTFTLQNATGSHSVNTAIAGNGSSLTLSASPTSISGSGSSVITVGAKEGNGNRGSFLVEISASPTCGATQTVTVTVNN